MFSVPGPGMMQERCRKLWPNHLSTQCCQSDSSKERRKQAFPQNWFSSHSPHCVPRWKLKPLSQEANMGQDAWILFPTLLPTGTVVQLQTVGDGFLKGEYPAQWHPGSGTLAAEGTTSVPCRRWREMQRYSAGPTLERRRHRKGRLA